MIDSKLPLAGTTIFSVMTALAQETGAINLAQGFPDFPADERLIHLVEVAMRNQHNQYAPMPGVPGLRASIAAKYQHVYNVAVDADTEVTVTPGGTAAIACAILATIRQGDEVITFSPAYDSYAPVVQLCGGVVQESPLLTPSYAPDWNHVLALITPRTKMVIINTPHNPSGAVWSADDIDTLGKICYEHNLLVVSDEVYEFLTYDGIQHTSLAAHPALRERTFVVTSFGKSCHVTGWKVGACVAPAGLTHEFRKTHQYINFSVHTPTQVALAEYTSDPVVFADIATMFNAKRNLFQRELEGSAWSIRPCQGSYFQLLGYEQLSNATDMELAHLLTRHAGVASIPLSPFGGRDAALRFCFAKQDDTLVEAAHRLVAFSRL